jgi:hypothetical protein
MKSFEFEVEMLPEANSGSGLPVLMAFIMSRISGYVANNYGFWIR